MKSKLYKLAVVLALLSLVPLIVFMAKRESPPEKITVEKHKEQVVKNFVLTSDDWELKASLGKFKGKDEIELFNGTLILKKGREVTIKFPYAVYFRQKEKVELKKVTLFGKEFRATSPRGIYYTDKKAFVTNWGCMIVLRKSNLIAGKICKMDIESKRITVEKKVKSVFREVEK